MNNEWEYYNHALVPTTAPHVDPDVSCIEDGTIWNLSKEKHLTLLARWTTDFDCGMETNWWYLIKDAPFDEESLSKSSRKHIRQSFKKCRVEMIDPRKHLDELYRVYEEAYARYQNADNKVDYDCFVQGCMEDNSDTEYWAGYEIESGRMIGYVTVIVSEEFVETSTAKFSTEYMKLRVSDALYATILKYYLNEKSKKYVTSGQRSINHITESQTYKTDTFGFRKAYCKVHIKYNPKYAWIIRIVYPMRRIISKFDRITLVHQVCGVLRLEEIVRNEER